MVYDWHFHVVSEKKTQVSLNVYSNFKLLTLYENKECSMLFCTALPKTVKHILSTSMLNCKIQSLTM